MKSAPILLVLCILVPASFCQQKRAARPATTTVSGHVYCADTNSPARKASVILQPADQIDAIRPGEDQHISSRGEMAQTLLDGSFTIAHVEPGTYYVIATQQGYVSPLTSVYVPPAGQPTSDPAKPKKPVMTAPRIVVQSNLPVSVNVSIERGAAVSGAILYDDGSPAVGVHVSILVHAKDSWTALPSSPVASQSYASGTDDQGRYRISGLPAGEYLLEASLSLQGMHYKVDEHNGTSVGTWPIYSLSFYGNGSSRRKDGTPIKVGPGEEVGGQDIQIPLTRLHTIRGSLVAAHDGHILNGGKLSILYADDRSEAGHTTVSKDDNTFTFAFVPEGDYILRADGVDNNYVEVAEGPDAWPPTHTEPKLLRSYGTAEQPIHVAGELTGVTVSAPDPPAPTARPALR
ncbi:MSCRAMM family protein [Occallatibacter riparius]|uniref:Carboxypeptidase-like regulatory domain-containing protein n=1 Tax=Occallatibacter riparius TaxID=1002689 RepID=A0A9J7BXY5_9BACT|nr:carboxypeptidase-like regulatory domain-containing protein [Occallatibacter riparius]UWZ85982.1 carboxypeptidase-like regulatory domain-containing protein [Occallatibacter riparius]